MEPRRPFLVWQRRGVSTPRTCRFIVHLFREICRSLMEAARFFRFGILDPPTESAPRQKASLELGVYAGTHGGRLLSMRKDCETTPPILCTYEYVPYCTDTRIRCTQQVVKAKIRRSGVHRQSVGFCFARPPYKTLFTTRSFR